MPPDPHTLLRTCFGYSAFRPGQEELIRAALQGRDALGVLPTGGGKSVCYQIPALASSSLTLVVSPLVSLMEDQVRRAREVGLPAWHLSATQPLAERRRVRAGVEASGAGLLFVAPERLVGPGFLGWVEGLRPGLIAIDEAHCISEWGHDFRPHYRRLGPIRGRLRAPVLALTATATPSVRTDVIENLELVDPVRVVRSFDRPNLTWGVERATTLPDRIGRIRERLRSAPGVGIVYAPTRRTVEYVRDALARSGTRTEAYHAGLPAAERSRVLKAFSTGECRVVVATNAFGMGIDKADVRWVTHVQLPSTLEAYYQEAGRAGRDGSPASCIAYFGRGDGAVARRFLNRSHPRPHRVDRILRRLRRRFGRMIDHAPADVVSALGRSVTIDDLPAVLAVLQRSGAVYVPPETSGRISSPSAGSQKVRLLLRGEPDLALLADLRARAAQRAGAVRRYATARGCRRTELLRYFGEDCRSRCGRCDRCSRPGRSAF